jgi:hypothetical protein
MRKFHSMTSLACGALAVTAFVAGAITAQPAKADAVSDFYKNKTMRILVGYPPAGSYRRRRISADTFPANHG